MLQTVNHMQGKELFCEKRSLMSLVSSPNPVADQDVTAIIMMRKITPKTQIVINIVVHKT